MSDAAPAQTRNCVPTQFVGEYEELLAAASPDYEFPDFDENTQATTFYTTGTTGLPKGVYFSHRQLVLHTMAELALFGLAAKQGRFDRDDVYMPITPMYHVHAWGPLGTGIPNPNDAGSICGNDCVGTTGEQGLGHCGGNVQRTHSLARILMKRPFVG